MMEGGGEGGGDKPGDSGGEKRDIRRPMNAFLIFCKRHRSMVREKHPERDNRSVTRILGDLWANLPDDEKSVYTNLAKTYKDAFMKANPDYKWHSTDRLPQPAKMSTRPTNIRPPRSLSVSDSPPRTDGDKMGGVNLLLLAGKQTMPVIDPVTAPPTQKRLASPDAMEANSALLQFAEMCSSSELASRHMDPTSLRSAPPKKRARHWSYNDVIHTDTTNQSPMPAPSLLFQTIPNPNLLPSRPAPPTATLTSQSADPTQKQEYTTQSDNQPGTVLVRKEREVYYPVKSDVPVQAETLNIPPRPNKEDKVDFSQNGHTLTQINPENVPQRGTVMNITAPEPQNAEMGIPPKKKFTKLHDRYKEETKMSSVLSTTSTGGCLSDQNDNAIFTCGKLVVDHIIDRLFSANLTTGERDEVPVNPSNSDIEKVRKIIAADINCRDKTQGPSSKVMGKLLSEVIQKPQNLVEKVIEEAYSLDLKQRVKHNPPLNPELKPRATTIVGQDARSSSAPRVEPRSLIAPKLVDRSTVSPKFEPRSTMATSLLATASTGPVKLESDSTVASKLDTIPAVVSKLDANSTVTPNPRPMVIPKLESETTTTPTLDPRLVVTQGQTVMGNTEKHTLESIPEQTTLQNLPDESLQVQNLQGQSLPVQNLQGQSLQVQNLQGQSLQVQNLQGQSLQVQNLQGQSLQVQNLPEKSVIGPMTTSLPVKMVLDGTQENQQKLIMAKVITTAPSMVPFHSVSSDKPSMNQNPILLVPIKEDREERYLDDMMADPSKDDAGDYLPDDDDGYSQPVRKSRRRNRGQRYQELINEGIIQPSKERLAARRHEQVPVYVSMIPTSMFVGEEIAEEETSAAAAERSRMILKRLSTDTDTGMVDEKRYRTGDFDLEAEIATLPPCSLEQVPRRRGPRKRSDSESARSKQPGSPSQGMDEGSAPDSPPSSTTTTTTASAAPPATQPATNTEPLTGSQKRKARKHSINRLVASSDSGSSGTRPPGIEATFPMVRDATVSPVRSQSSRPATADNSAPSTANNSIPMTTDNSTPTPTSAASGESVSAASSKTSAAVGQSVLATAVVVTSASTGYKSTTAAPASHISCDSTSTASSNLSKSTGDSASTSTSASIHSASDNSSGFAAKFTFKHVPVSTTKSSVSTHDSTIATATSNASASNGDFTSTTNTAFIPDFVSTTTPASDPSALITGSLVFSCKVRSEQEIPSSEESTAAASSVSLLSSGNVRLEQQKSSNDTLTAVTPSVSSTSSSENASSASVLSNTEAKSALERLSSSGDLTIASTANSSVLSASAIISSSALSDEAKSLNSHHSSAINSSQSASVSVKEKALKSCDTLSTRLTNSSTQSVVTSSNKIGEKCVQINDDKLLDTVKQDRESTRDTERTVKKDECFVSEEDEQKNVPLTLKQEQGANLNDISLTVSAMCRNSTENTGSSITSFETKPTLKDKKDCNTRNTDDFTSAKQQPNIETLKVETALKGKLEEATFLPCVNTERISKDKAMEYESTVKTVLKDYTTSANVKDSTVCSADSGHTTVTERLSLVKNMNILRTHLNPPKDHPENASVPQAMIRAKTTPPLSSQSLKDALSSDSALGSSTDDMDRESSQEGAIGEDKSSVFLSETSGLLCVSQPVNQERWGVPDALTSGLVDECVSREWQSMPGSVYEEERGEKETLNVMSVVQNQDYSVLQEQDYTVLQDQDFPGLQDSRSSASMDTDSQDNGSSVIVTVSSTDCVGITGSDLSPFSGATTTTGPRVTTVTMASSDAMPTALSLEMMEEEGMVEGGMGGNSMLVGSPMPESPSMTAVHS